MYTLADVYAVCAVSFRGVVALASIIHEHALWHIYAASLAPYFSSFSGSMWSWLGYRRRVANRHPSVERGSHISHTKTDACTSQDHMLNTAKSIQNTPHR